MRPVGGLIFGIIGDKMGRKTTLQLSMIMMFVSTFILGCLPSYATIGIWAPIILTLLRLFQGISVGGQLVGSLLYIIESARPEKRGFYSALTIATSSSGEVLASWVVALLNTFLSSEQMSEWGWRIPFLSSILMAALGFISQKHMEPSREFVDAKETSSPTEMINVNPLQKALKYHWKTILMIVAVIIPWCCGGYLNYTFLPVYLQCVSLSK